MSPVTKTRAKPKPAVVATDRPGAYSVADLLRAMLADNAPAATANLVGVLQTILDRVSALERRVDGLEARMDGLEARMDRLEACMDRLEARMDRLEARMDRLEARVAALETAVAALAARFDTTQRLQWATLGALIVFGVASLAR